MTPQEINDIKDKASRECGYDDFNDAIVRCSDFFGAELQNVVDLAIELASKREIKAPSELELGEKCPHRFQYGFKNREIWMESANWAIERVKEMNK